jgi:hypothetical protein
MIRIPNVGEFIHFWDDGKVGLGRHYICKIERIVPFSEADKIKLKAFDSDLGESVEKDLKSIWELERDDYDWLYANETDVFIEASCPKFDKYNLWFVRTKSGGFFSMDIQNYWQGGQLDTEETILKNVIKSWKEDDLIDEKRKDEIIKEYINCKY